MSDGYKVMHCTYSTVSISTKNSLLFSPITVALMLYNILYVSFISLTFYVFFKYHFLSSMIN